MVHRCILASFLFATAFAVSVQSASAEDRRVRIVNNTGYTIERFYGSNKGSNSWEEDILGQEVLESGQSVVVNFDDASGFCKFDFRAVFNDGDEVVENGVNVCEIGTFTFN